MTFLRRWTQHKHGLLFGVIGVSDTCAGSHVWDGGDRDDDDAVGDGY